MNRIRILLVKLGIGTKERSSGYRQELQIPVIITVGSSLLIQKHN